ncbi:cytochrome-c oxidase, cbb3-type subunit III [Pusillimonas sp. CC-YST705]|uniref:Cbb3-type cytochrome c oxidase subunit n=1 Tax=Mesopusillimonas faecipullorum TaxID=2755040 RepID=A0ABS8CB91_9BURK|nr:cytochrome-c oxidase, cbb3-type subunit III [Mesopusillimonas faecipullorum]MCB5363288.1 cytochrome-c oxidase, cbb3-type subunit III [Mesopusillimonas faecipullorum]
MSDFVSSSWGYYIAAVSIAGIIYCIWLLFTQRAWLGKNLPKGEEMGHVWDGNLTELNNPVPRWWTVFYLGLCIFGFGYLILYPGLGEFKGLLNYSSAEAVREAQAEQAARVAPLYARFASMDIAQVAADPEARQIGQRLFLNNCAQCHGSDARGAPSFPNLADGDWLHGGEPEQIMQTITNGRVGIMPPWGAVIKPAEASDIAQYVRSLSGLAADPLRLVPGKRGYDSYCVACHGAEAKGNTALGAPNLTDGTWLYGSSEATIVDIILNGRHNEMPAQGHLLSPEQIRILTAWVWGLSNSSGATVSANK